MSDDFHKTVMGKRYYEKDIPMLVEGMRELAAQVGRQNVIMERLVELMEKQQREMEAEKPPIGDFMEYFKDALFKGMKLPPEYKDVIFGRGISGNMELMDHDGNNVYDQNGNLIQAPDAWERIAEGVRSLANQPPVKVDPNGDSVMIRNNRMKFYNDDPVEVRGVPELTGHHVVLGVVKQYDPKQSLVRVQLIPRGPESPQLVWVSEEYVFLSSTNKRILRPGDPIIVSAKHLTGYDKALGTVRSNNEIDQLIRVDFLSDPITGARMPSKWVPTDYVSYDESGK